MKVVKLYQTQSGIEKTDGRSVPQQMINDKSQYDGALISLLPYMSETEKQ